MSLVDYFEEAEEIARVERKMAAMARVENDPRFVGVLLTQAAIAS